MVENQQDGRTGYMSAVNADEAAQPRKCHTWQFGLAPLPPKKKQGTLQSYAFVRFEREAGQEIDIIVQRTG